jgi:hypothetical protein
MGALLGVKYSTNTGQRYDQVQGGRSTWAIKHSPTVELFVLSPVTPQAPSPVSATTPATPVVAVTEKKTAEPSEPTKPVPQPRPRLKAADTMDAHAVIGSHDQSMVDVGVKGRQFLQKLAADIESRCALEMAREKIQPVEGMTVSYIIEINTLDGKIEIRKFSYPIQVAPSAFFASFIDGLSPLEQLDPELHKTFGDVVRIEVTLS